MCCIAARNIQEGRCLMDDSTRVCRACGHPHYVRRAMPNICYGQDITDQPQQFNWQDPRMGFILFDICMGCSIMVECWHTWAVSLSEYHSKQKQETGATKNRRVKHKPTHTVPSAQKQCKIIHFITKAEKEHTS